jgi:hypothetical protein
MSGSKGPKEMTRLTTVLCTCLLLAGCSTAKDVYQAVSIQPDSYCVIAKKQKRTWSLNDTYETIEEARRINGAIDKACGTGAKVS